QIPGRRYGLRRQRGIDGLDRLVARKALKDGTAFAAVDAKLQLPGLAAGGQLGDQRKQIVAIRIVAASDEGEPSLMLDHAIVVLGKAQLVQSVDQGALGCDQERADMQPGIV